MEQSSQIKVHFEGVRKDQVELALRLGHKVSVICDSNELNEDNIQTLSKVDYLVVRADPSLKNIDILTRVPNAKLLSGIRVYISEEGNDFGELAKRIKTMGFDFLHVSKKLTEGRQSDLDERERERIADLSKLHSDRFKVILPNNLGKVFNDKFTISDEYNNSRKCVFSRHRAVLSKNRFYPCYTHSIIDSDRFSSDTIKEMKTKRFGEGCTDCACIYENDIFEQIYRVAGKVNNKTFLLGYEKKPKVD
jgi:hypothetical protein